MAITFKRILHPIGQGAFFTEQFFDTSGNKALSENKCIFNVVYDCGSFTKGKKYAPQIIKDEMDTIFNQKEHIDFLFISHFDGDHTNGLEYLLQKTRMDDKTYVFIPFHLSLMLAAEKESLIFDRFLEQAADLHVHFIWIRASESLDSLNRLEPVDIRHLNNRSETKEILLELSSETNDPFWCYLPFMPPGVNEFENDFLREANNIRGLNLDDVESIIKHKDELKRVYNDIGVSKYKNTKINTNSLFLLSFPVKDKVKKSHFWVDGRFYIDSCWGYHHKFDLSASCLYTGDSSLKNEIDYKQVVSSSSNVVNRFSDSNNIGIMQIPHHGSIKCYPKGIAKDDLVSSAFANFEPYYSQRIFYTNILRDFSNEKPLFLITDEYSTRLEIYADL